MASLLSAKEKDRPPTLTELSSHELKSDLLTDSLSRSLMSVMVSGEMAMGGLMDVGEDTSLVWGHAMSCGRSDGLFRVIGGNGHLRKNM
jgi:hypothetical protein